MIHSLSYPFIPLPENLANHIIGGITAAELHTYVPAAFSVSCLLFGALELARSYLGNSGETAKNTGYALLALAVGLSILGVYLLIPALAFLVFCIIFTHLRPIYKRTNETLNHSS